MKLIIKDDNGHETELKEIETLNKDSDIVFLMLNVRLRTEDIKNYETFMTNKIGKKCIVLNNDIAKLMSM